MSQAPTPYTRKNNFAADALNPALALADTCEDLDAEFDAVRGSVNQTISRLNEIQRDDGLLRSGVLDPGEYALFQRAVSAAAGAEAAQEAAESAAGAAQLSATASAASALTSQTSENQCVQLKADTDALKSQAAQSATSAAQSATQAAGALSSVQTSAANASSSAANASASEANAASSASAASASASTASTAAASAQTALDQFDDRYLGANSSDPSVDNDGQALQTGAMYYNTTLNETRIWNGTAWVGQLAYDKYRTQVPNATNNVALFDGMAIEPASTWKTRSIVDSLDAILFPTIPPTYTEPSVSISVGSAPSTIELGLGWSATATPTWNPADGGSITSHQWVVNGTAQGSVSGSTLNSRSTTTPVSFRLDVSFAEGPQKPNNKGQPQGDPPGPGTKQSNTISAPSQIIPWFHLRAPSVFTVNQFLSAIQAMPNGLSSAASIGISGGTIARVIESADASLGSGRVGVRVPYNLSTPQCLGVAICVDTQGGFSAKQGFFVSGINNGPVTAVFSVSAATSVVRNGNLWTRNFIFYITPSLSISTDAFIELTNSVPV